MSLILSDVLQRLSKEIWKPKVCTLLAIALFVVRNLRA